MLARRLRRCPNIDPTLVQCLVFAGIYRDEIKWNAWGFRPPSCTYRLNWVRITCCGWLDEWHDTARQTQDSKFQPWWSEAEYAISRLRRLPTVFNLYEWAGKILFLFLKHAGQSGVRTRDLRLSKQAALSTTPGPPPCVEIEPHPAKHETLRQCWVNVGQTSTNIDPTLVQCLLFPGICIVMMTLSSHRGYRSQT